MRNALRAALEELADNARLLLFIVGFALMYVGVAALSRPVANLSAGLILMVLAVMPYARRPQKKGE
jgi:hypothetical protein